SAPVSLQTARDHRPSRPTRPTLNHDAGFLRSTNFRSVASEVVHFGFPSYAGKESSSAGGAAPVRWPSNSRALWIGGGRPHSHEFAARSTTPRVVACWTFAGHRGRRLC